jgi:hypothetical protein
VAIVITLAQLVIDLLYFLLPVDPVNAFNLVITEARALIVFWSAVAAETVVVDVAFFVVVVAFFVVVVAFFVVVVGFFVVVVVAFAVVVVLALVVVGFFVVVVVGFLVVVVAVVEQFKAIG